MHTRRARACTSLAVACGWVVLALVAVSPSTWGQSLPPGQPVALPVENNHCECILPISRPDDKFFLVVGSASLDAGPFRVTIQSEALDETAMLPATMTSANKGQQEAAEIIENKKKSSLPPLLPPAPVFHSQSEEFSASEYPPSDEPLRTRNFFLFVKERDFYDPQSYVTVSGELKGVGRHCQVYVDRDFGNPSS